MQILMQVYIGHYACVYSDHYAVHCAGDNKSRYASLMTVSLQTIMHVIMNVIIQVCMAVTAIHTYASYTSLYAGNYAGHAILCKWY